MMISAKSYSPAAWQRRIAAALMLTLVWTASASAQLTGGDAGTGQTGGTGTGGIAAGTGTATGTGGDTGTGTGIGSALDAETAFAGIERGDTVGSTAGTGESFSFASPNQGGTARGTGGIGGLGGLGGGLGALGNLFGGLNQTGGQAAKPAIRTRLRSAISIPPASPALVQRVAAQRFQSIPGKPQLRGIRVTMDGRTAVLSGTVRDEGDRRMSEMLVRLEPGVSRIDNQIVVQQEVPSSSDVNPR